MNGLPSEDVDFDFKWGYRCTHVDYCDEMRPCPIHEARGSDQGDDLLEWLRESQQATAFDEDARMYGRAADEIESLRARLRGVSTGEWIEGWAKYTGRVGDGYGHHFIVRTERNKATGSAWTPATLLLHPTDGGEG